MLCRHRFSSLCVLLATLTATVSFLPAVSPFAPSPAIAPPSRRGDLVGDDHLKLQGSPIHRNISGRRRRVPIIYSSNNDSGHAEEARKLLERAQALREEVAAASTGSSGGGTAEAAAAATATARKGDEPNNERFLPLNVKSSDDEQAGEDYRLYVDIGREPGTWMEPRWGASGSRIEFAVDVRFLSKPLAADGNDDDSAAAAKVMADKSFFGKGKNSSPVRALLSGEKARLRGGFDEMRCRGGAYRVDDARNRRGAAATVRFFIEVDGTAQTEADNSPYGDVSVPKGNLFFSIPAFSGGRLSQLSSKEGPVTIRQMGWNTGFWREESRIVGVFRAVPLRDAKKKDGY